MRVSWGTLLWDLSFLPLSLPPNSTCLYTWNSTVPLEDTIRIAADELYHSDILLPCLTEASFTNLLRKVTSGVEFSFDEVIYRQTDGVAMGSPLGPVLANIFVGFHEQQLALEDNTDILLYRRFVDDTFALNASMEQSEKLLSTLNKLHPALEFTCEHEQNGKLPFLDSLVIRNPAVHQRVSFETTIYRKPTYTPGNTPDGTLSHLVNTKSIL